TIKSQFVISCHGLIKLTPVAAKSGTLRVTTFELCSSAVAAINAPRADFGSGTWTQAKRLATALSMLRIRSSNPGHIWVSNQSPSLVRVAPLNAQDTDFQLHQGQSLNEHFACMNASDPSHNGSISFACSDLSQRKSHFYRQGTSV
ncbi:MAG: hypothetical protein AAGK79_19650, partial [Pseudomonadota bacterium]